MSPSEFQTAEATSNGAGPLGQNSATGWRYMQVHDDVAGTARTFNEIAFRRDSTATTAYNQYSVRLTLILSNAATTAATIDSTFQNNHGSNRLTVVNDQTVTFPSTPRGGTPAPFVYVIPFQVPFSYDGNGSLCWEVRTTNYTNMLTTYYFDAANGSSTNPPLGISAYGFGCRHSTRIYPMTATGFGSMNWPAGAGTIYFDGQELPENSAVFASLGVSKTVYSGLPLPFLMPGTLTAPSGPCALLTSIDASFGVATSGTTARLTLPIPASASMNGVHVYCQYLAPDAGAGLFGLVSSNAVEYCWVEPFGNAPVSQVYATSAFATTGTTRLNYGYVVQLR